MRVQEDTKTDALTTAVASPRPTKGERGESTLPARGGTPVFSALAHQPAWSFGLRLTSTPSCPRPPACRQQVARLPDLHDHGSQFQNKSPQVYMTFCMYRMCRISY